MIQTIIRTNLVLHTTKLPDTSYTEVLLFDTLSSLPENYHTTSLNHVFKTLKAGKNMSFFDGRAHVFCCYTPTDAPWVDLEKIRKAGALCFKQSKELGIGHVVIKGLGAQTETLKAFCEGFYLSNYSFDTYKKEADSFDVIVYIDPKLADQTLIEEWAALWQAVLIARDLVNEPYSYLNAVTLAQEFERLGAEAGFDVEVWNEAKISAQKMGGLLAVNNGSTVPPTFTIMEYKPQQYSNQQPIVLVGKGVVYDTGGMSLKPTPNSMDFMKCDMGGSATAVGIIYAVAKAKLPLHIIALVPATDNRPGENAYVPGDVITMYSGHTVEVKNTDAEGRLILADALHYAKKLKPQLLLDFATLTGSAVRAIGPYASAIMGNADQHVISEICTHGLTDFEKFIQFPLWDEYEEELHSHVADFSNLGKSEGGHMSAAMFLQKFTDYPWIHIDIAGTAFTHSPKDYLTFGGTGVGIRPVFNYLKSLTK